MMNLSIDGLNVDGFDMPFKLNLDDNAWIFPETKWQTTPIKTEAIEVDRDFLCEIKNFNVNSLNLF